MITKIGLDFGHGGYDHGATGNGIVEKNKVLEIGLKVNERLKQHGMQTVLARNTDNYISLQNRCNIYNRNNVQLMVSFHINSFTNSNANGFETYIVHPARDPHGTFTKSKKAGQSIHNHIAKSGLFKRDRGLKQANFKVLRDTKMASILLELGFLSNYNDSQVLKNKTDELVEIITESILIYCGIKYIPKNKPNGFYRVICGSYKDKSNAEKQVDKLKKLGIDSFISYYKR